MPLPTILYRTPDLSDQEVISRAAAFFGELSSRRSVRSFSTRAVPIEAIESAVATASTAPSGAHRQPWTFVAVQDADVKRQIRQAAEAEERINYDEGRLPPEWRQALEPLGTDWHKPYLETAPWLVMLFEQRYGLTAAGEQFKNFYVKESVGIAPPHSESHGIPGQGTRPPAE